MGSTVTLAAEIVFTWAVVSVVVGFALGKFLGWASGMSRMNKLSTLAQINISPVPFRHTVAAPIRRVSPAERF